MIKLSNGATVHAAYLLPAGLGTKPHGVVLGETPTDWVTWHVYWDGEFVISENEGHEVWEAETGHYFQKAYTQNGNNPELMARFDYGLRLRRFIESSILDGVKS